MTAPAPTRSLGSAAFVVAAAAGFLIWWFSEPLTGRREPWDGAVFWYLAALFVLGFAVTLFLRARPFAAYWGAFAGQALFLLLPFVACPAAGTMCSDQSNLLPLGLVALLVFTLPALVGAFLAARARDLLMRG